MNDAPVDSINPQHYRQHPSGVECIQITEHMNFNLGNAVHELYFLTINVYNFCSGFS